LNRNVPGVYVPDHLIKALAKTPRVERIAKSIELMAEVSARIQ
jgi:hypothetical protein